MLVLVLGWQISWFSVIHARSRGHFSWCYHSFSFMKRLFWIISNPIFSPFNIRMQRLVSSPACSIKKQGILNVSTFIYCASRDCNRTKEISKFPCDRCPEVRLIKLIRRLEWGFGSWINRRTLNLLRSK